MLIAFEGPDRAGKSTQCRLLAEKLRAAGVDVEVFAFPKRSTRVGQLLDEHLRNIGQGQGVLPAQASHLLFAANRWELEDDMSAALRRGTVVLVDRYVASGTAYSAAQNVPRTWCAAADQGLPVPDRTILFRLENPPTDRDGFGDERYETVSVQRRIIVEFDALQTPTWKVVDALGDIETVHGRVLEALRDLNPGGVFGAGV